MKNKILSIFVIAAMVLPDTIGLASNVITNVKCQMLIESRTADFQRRPTRPTRPTPLSIVNCQLSINKNPFEYSGYYTDAESGFYYCKARYYSPLTQKFSSRDTFNLANRYAYCDANPIMKTDPDGHFPIPSSLNNVLSSLITLQTSNLSWLIYPAMGLMALSSLGAIVAYHNVYELKCFARIYDKNCISKCIDPFIKLYNQHPWLVSSYFAGVAAVGTVLNNYATGQTWYSSLLTNAMGAFILYRFIGIPLARDYTFRKNPDREIIAICKRYHPEIISSKMELDATDLKNVPISQRIMLRFSPSIKEKSCSDYEKHEIENLFHHDDL